MKSKLSFYIILFILSYFSYKTQAHPSPNTAILLDIQSNGVEAELQLPLSELSLAFGDRTNLNPKTLIEQYSTQLKAYILEHLHPTSPDKQNWTVEVYDMAVQNVQQIGQTNYQDLIIHLWLQPPTGVSPRNFTFNYDVIIHQVVTHNAIVSIRQDWESGVLVEHPVEVGVIAVDPRDNSITPLSINQEKGGLWGGFKAMIRLGMRHIAGGSDHLMFLLVLLMAAPLLPVIKIITAFTIGHSFTLLIGAIGWVKLPTQPIEVLIAFSIFISAIHAIRPIFPQKEAYIAIGFGLIHGLAFASTLSNLNLPKTQMALSILEFNVGIELMQLMVMALIVPWLIILSKGSFYTPVRVGGAIFAGVVALAWMIERIIGHPNAITEWASKMIKQSPNLILLLTFMALISYWFEQNKK